MTLSLRMSKEQSELLAFALKDYLILRSKNPAFLQDKINELIKLQDKLENLNKQ